MGPKEPPRCMDKAGIGVCGAAEGLHGVREAAEIPFKAVIPLCVVPLAIGLPRTPRIT